MNLYNMLMGMTPAAFYILPCLGKHPHEYPRFRDCFIGDSDRPETEGKIIIYTRTGGGNRDYYRIDNFELTQMPTYLFDYDDDFDCTYANFVFDIPQEWAKDIECFLEGRIEDVSDEYINHICSIYPKIEDKIREQFEAVKS